MIVILPVFAVTAACVFGGFVMFDRVLRLEHERHHDTWIRDGKPSGFFWIPSDGSFFSKYLSGARDSLLWSWLFSRPRWAVEEPEAQEDLRCMRRLVFTSWIGWALIALILTLGSAT